ncbi:nicotinate phosphoribosyltransferase [Trichormus sp. NMC-1]|uniref:nicotinate phosphoribosyltransferase n=1 Tax=Trichormus sp. NMC-1 TaxID=1853259 RepID=UPI0008DC2632|nr:nicotinate phosphoribosyltransferase [Trichormus sp. NMC-1]
MAIFRIVASITQFISEAVIRIFGPNDDAYPIIGFQPFTGDPYKRGRAESW